MNTTHHSGMILSTLNISSHSYALGFLKGLILMERVLFDYKPMIIPKLVWTFILQHLEAQNVKASQKTF